MFRKLFFQFCLALLISITASAQENEDIVEVGRIYSHNFYNARSMCLNEDICFVGSHSYLPGVNIANPDEPTIETRIYTHDYAFQVAVSRSYLFSGGGSGLSIYDLNAQDEPQMVGHSREEFFAYDLALWENYCYCADWQGGRLRIFDISDPSRPIEVGNLAVNQMVRTVSYADGLICMGYGSTLSVIDVSNPTQPQILGSAEFAGTVMRLKIVEDFAYLVDIDNNSSVHHFRIVSLANPREPRLISSLEISGENNYLYDLAIEGDFAALAGYSKMRFIDISDREQPFEIGYRVPDYPIRTIAMRLPFIYIISDLIFIIYNVQNLLGEPDLVVAEEDRAHNYENVPVGIAENWSFNLSNEGFNRLEVHDLELEGDDAFSIMTSSAQGKVRLWIDMGRDVNDNRINGVTFDDERFYISGGNNGNQDNWIYVFDLEGQLVDRLEQPNQSPWGMADLAWDGELIWGADRNTIYGLTPAAQVVRQFAAPLENVRSIAYDPTRDLLWIADFNSRILGIDRNGDLVEELPRIPNRLYGMAWHPEDPDGYFLYLFTWSQDEPMGIAKLNPVNGEILPVMSLKVPRGDIPRCGGLAITNNWNPPIWTIVGTVDDTFDALGIWQLSHHYLGDAISIGAQSEHELTISFNPVEPGEYQAQLRILSNDAGNEVVEISLEGSAIDNHAPRWVSLPEEISVAAGESISLQLTAEDPENSRLTIKLTREGIPPEIQFTEVGNGIAEINWQTRYHHEGEYTLNLLLTDGLNTIPGTVFIRVLPPLSKDDDERLPRNFAVNNVYPNPFNNVTKLKYSLDRERKISLVVLDITGRELATLKQGVEFPGTHEIVWDASNLAAGVYILRLESEGEVMLKKAMLLR